MAEVKSLQWHDRRTGSAPKRPLRVRLAVLAGIVSLGGMSILSGGPRANSGMFQATGTPQTGPDAALRQLRATEDAILTTYGWVDRKNGIVHIPIDRAMDLLLQRGLPTRAPEQEPTGVF
jgi:hypothetical protein